MNADAAAAAAKPKKGDSKAAAAAINAGADLIADIGVSLIKAQTEREFNDAKIKEMQAAREQKFISDEQKRTLDLQIANLKSANKKLEIEIQNLTKQRVAAIQASGNIFSNKLKYGGDKTILIVAALGAILLIGTVFILNKD